MKTIFPVESMRIHCVKTPKPNVFKRNIVYDMIYKLFSESAISVCLYDEKIHQISKYGIICYDSFYEAIRSVTRT